jgi:hypothetical protein
MSSKEENSDFTYLGKRIDKALNYVQTNKPGLIEWFKEYIETPYLNIIYGELELEEEDYTFDYLDSLLDDIEEKFNIIFETKQIMSNEFKRMIELAGLPITENKVEEENGNKKLTTKAVREHWGEFANTDNPVSHPYGVTYEIYEYEGDTLGKLVDTAPYVDLFTTKEQAEDYINMFNSNSLEERNLKDQQYVFDMLYDENKEYRHNEPKKSLNENFVGMGMVGNIFDREKTDYELAFEHFTKSTSILEDYDKSSQETEEESLHQEESEELEEGMISGLYTELKNVLFPYYTDLTGEERIAMIDDIISELNAYIGILQGEKTAK